MPDENSKPRPFDVATVEHLLKLMTDHDLSEVDLKEGDQRIRLRKGSAVPIAFPPVGAYTPAAPAPAPLPPAGGLPSPGSPAGGLPSPGSPSPAAPAKKYHEITSELVGTFYARPAPDKPEFVKVGAPVTPDTTVCLIIAMKVNNEIKAGLAGTIAEVCVKNEDFVDFGTVLFRVDPS